MTDWIDTFVTAKRAETPGLVLMAHRGANGYIDLNTIKLPAGQRGAGLGDRILGELASLADRHGDTVATTPTADFGGTVTKLTRWYSRHGFASNKGRSKDFATRQTMVRRPK